MNKFIERDQQVVRKCYDLKHLFQFIEEEYSDFLNVFLKEHLVNKSFHLVDLHDKITQEPITYSLVVKNYSLSQPMFKGKDRKEKIIDDTFAELEGVSRQLILKVQMHLVSTNQITGEQTICSKLKTNYELGRIPLLVNSKFDPYKSDQLKPFKFIISGASRYLYNIVEQNPMVKNLKSISSLTIDQNILSYKLTSSVNETLLNQITFNPKTFESFFMFRNPLKRKVNLFSLFRLLDVTLPQILSLKNSKINELNLLNLVYSEYECEKSEVYKRVYQQLFNKEPENEKEKVDEVLGNCLFFKGDLEQNKQIKKKNLFRAFRDLLNYYENPKDQIFQDSLALKKVFTVKDHFKKAYLMGFTEILEKARNIILKDIGFIKKSKSLSVLIRPEILKKSFKKYFTMGNTKTNDPYSEYVQITNNLELISNQRKLVSTLNKDLVHANYRSLHPSKPGRVCPIQTPYSRSVGLVQYLSLGAKLSKYIDFNELKIVFSGDTPLMVNDVYMGSVRNDSNFQIKLQKLKKKYNISYNFLNNEIHIRTSPGRILKPFYRVDKEIPLITQIPDETFNELTLDELVKQGSLVYLDTLEQLYSNIATTIEHITKETQYLYVNPSMYVSFMSSGLPLISTNAGHRAPLSIRLMDQAIGGKSKKNIDLKKQLKLEYMVKTDPSIYGTIMDQEVSQENLGQNVILCFSSGNVEEDSIVINKSAVERGLFDSIMYKSIKKQSVLKEDNTYCHELVEENISPFIDKDGLPVINSLVDQDSVMSLDTNGISRQNILSPQSPFYVNEVLINNGLVRSCQIEVTFSKLRSVDVGDKLGNRSGLKGIVGDLIPEYNLWIPESGIVPSVIVSNHVINSRMIFGPLFEILLTKMACIQGKNVIVPSFPSGDYVKELTKKARKICSNKERMYNIETFKEFQLSVGPTKMFLLEHHGRDKMYIRTSVGGVNPFTRQPGAGRNVRGGLRFGEMQTNACIEYCANDFLRDRLSVDNVKVRVCNCGYLSNDPGNYCKICKKEPVLRELYLPYAFVMFTKMLKAVHIETKYLFEDDLVEQNLEVEEDPEEE